MNLPDNEQRVYDILCTHYPDWILSDTIVTTLGRFQNHTAKLLLFIINKGLAELRPVVKDGKKMKYCEYRRKPVEAEISPDNSKGNNLPENSEDKKEPIVQAGKQCSCGSWYRRGKNCNICGVVV